MSCPITLTIYAEISSFDVQFTLKEKYEFSIKYEFRKPCFSKYFTYMSYTDGHWQQVWPDPPHPPPPRLRLRLCTDIKRLLRGQHLCEGDRHSHESLLIVNSEEEVIP